MANRHFFRRYEGRGSYDLFSSYSYYLPGIGGMFMLLAMFILGTLLGNLVTMGLQATLGADFAKQFGTVISYPVMFIPPMLYSSVKSRLNSYNTEEVLLDNKVSGGTRLAIIVTVATMAAAFITEPVTALLPPMPEWLEKVMDQMLEGSPLWATLLSVSVFAPLFEEWLCRGMILRGLLTKMKPATAIVISAAFFAILHMNPWQAIPAFCLGLLFGFVYYKTGSLKLTMLVHCVNNTMAVVLSKIPVLKEAETFMDVMNPWAYAGAYICLAVALASAIVILSSYRKAQEQE